MERVEVDVVETEVVSRFGGDRLPGLSLLCQKCDYRVKVCGIGPRSYRAGYCLLRQQCPRGEWNYYVCDEEPEEEQP